MNTRKGAVLLAAIAVAACGGGGGGDGGNGGSGGGGGGDGGGGGGGSGDPTVNGSAEIVFPWPRSAATAPTLSVRGIAADPEGVAGVSVNGVAATITATGPTSTQKPNGKADLEEGEVEWSADIALAKGENVLTVAVEDEGGDVTEDVDTAMINYVEVPVTFTLDPDSTRVVGLSFTLTPTGYVQHLVQHDYTTLEQEIFGEIPAAPSDTCFRRFEDEFLYLSLGASDTWRLYKLDLTTGQTSLLLEIPPEMLDPGAGFENAPAMMRLVCGGMHTSAYVLVNYADDVDGNGFDKSRLLEIDLTPPGASILFETDTSAPEPWIVHDIALADDENTIVAMSWLGTEPLSGIAPGGIPTELTPGLHVSGLALTPALAIDRVYMATFEGVDEVDLTVPEKRNISVVDDAHPLVFSQVRSIGLDPANNRVIVGDDEVDALIAIDIATGERTELLSRKVGTGTALIAPRRFALSADATRAYVADDGSNAPARLFEIDLASGDRRLIGDISQAITYVVTGLALDEEGGRVFVSGPDVILEVDLATENVQPIADSTSTGLTGMIDLLLDLDNNRLLFGSFAVDGIFALDLTTRTTSVVSQEGGKGSGPPFGGVVSLTRVAETSELYVAGQTSEAVARVDLETGDREALVTGCDGSAATFANLDQVLYSDVLDELLISGDEFYSLDLGTGDCAALPRWVLPLQVRITPANQVLAVILGALVQIDRATGEVVIVSK